MGVTFNNATLEKMDVHGKTYHYIDYNNYDQFTSVDGIILPVSTPSVRKEILNTSGFFRAMLDPLFDDESIHRIVILSVTENGMIRRTRYYFDNGKPPFKTTSSVEPDFVKYYAKSLTRKKLPHVRINTLEFLQEQPKNSDFLNILNKYYNPKSPDDTGLYVNGKMIQYGQTVTINNMRELIKDFKQLQNSSMAKLNIDKIKVIIYENGPSHYNIIGNCILYNGYNQYISHVEDDYYDYIQEKSDLTLDEYIEQRELNIIHSQALDANQQIDFGWDQDEIIDEYIKHIDNKIIGIHEPRKFPITLNLLLECIRRNYVTV